MDTCLHTPVINDVDFVVLGDNISALSAAFGLNAEGAQVLIVAKGSFLLDDLCIPGMLKKSDGWMEHLWIKKIIGNSTVNAYGNKLILHPDRIKINTEKTLLDSGIEYLYGAHPLDITCIPGGKKLLRIAGKFGVHGIKCWGVLDLRMVPARNERVILNALNGPDIAYEQVITVKTEVGNGYEVVLRPGAYGKGHILLDVPADGLIENEFYDGSYLLVERALDAFGYLKNSRKEYKNLELGRFCFTGYRFDYNIEEQINKGIKASLDRRSEFVKGSGGKIALPEGCKLTSYNRSVSYNEFENLECGTIEITRVKRCELVIAGGGTSGALAAIHSARQGIKTVLIEFNHQLGGTGTVGGVSSYWFGKRFGDTAQLDERINKIYEKLGLYRKPGIWGYYDNYNPDLKSHVLFEMCREAGVEVYFNTIAFAAICENGSKRVCGVSAVSPDGTVALLGQYVLDATGDGDIGAFANAAYEYGSKRDCITYWASLAQYTSPKEYKNNFSSTVMVDDPNDYTRFIALGRQRGENIYDHGVYVAPRESRHVRGLYEITLKDVVTFREYEDTIYTCFSNYDPKGKLDSDMVYAGVLPPQNSIAVPLRAFIPVDEDNKIIEGLIIGGKAFSCTHNAMPGMRMQPDLQHQGAVLGLVIAEAILNKVNPMQLNFKLLQEKIRCATGDVLKLHRRKKLNACEIVASIDKNTRLEWTDFPFEDEVDEVPISIAMMTASSHEILPFLEKRFKTEKDENVRLVLAMGILWHGSDAATDAILNHIKDCLKKHKGLPEREGPIKCVQLLPDHGIMAELVYKLNLLAWSKRSDIYHPFLEILNRIKCIRRDYRDIRKSHFHYVESFAYVAERTVLPEFIPMLKELLMLPEFKKCEDLTDILSERLIILRLSLIRSLARCGDVTGYEGLIDLLDHPCASIGISACMELRALTGMKFGRQPSVWKKFIHSSDFNPFASPITQKIW